LRSAAVAEKSSFREKTTRLFLAFLGSVRMSGFIRRRR